MGTASRIFLIATMTAACVAPSAAVTAAEYEIAIARMKFAAPPDTLRVGDVIVWRNDDIFRHTATARDTSFDLDLPPKSQRRLILDKAGTIDFYCRFHPMMKGRLDVQP